MEKKKIILTALVAISFLICVYIKSLDSNSNVKNNQDAINFKNEYEALNNKNLEGNQVYKKIEISEENPIIYASYEEIEKIISEGTGVIYFGFPECPWCRSIVPVLLDAAKENGIDKVYYFNALSIRDKKHLDQDGNIVVDDAGTAEYSKLVSLLYDWLGEYQGLNDSSIKRLYFPTVVFVNEGNIIAAHTGTVDSHTNPNEELTELQREELNQIYSNYMLRTLGVVCGTDEEKWC